MGTAAILGVRFSPLRHFVQIGGSAFRIGTEDLNRAMEEMPQLRAVMHNHVHATLLQSSQSAACSLSHTLLQRLARWLLSAQDRSARDDLRLAGSGLRHRGSRQENRHDERKSCACSQ